MPDPQYTTMPAILESKGIAARPSDDTLPPGFYLNMNNVEELEENTMASRLGSIIINKTGNTANPLPGPVHSLARLVNATFNSSWRYAGAGTALFRRTGDTAGPYTQIATGLSGNQWSATSYRPTLSSFPYLYISDGFLMLKDNGTVTSRQGIFAPVQPVQAQIAAPQTIILDSFENAPGSYAIVNATGATTLTRVSTTLTSPVTVIGVQKVTVASMVNIVPLQLLNIDIGGSAETVLVLSVPVDNSGFLAQFTKTHAPGAIVAERYLSVNVGASTTATITKAGPFNLSVFPDSTDSDGADYLCFYINVGNPANISQIQIALDVGDGSFSENYYFKLIVPSIYQDQVSEAPNTSADQTNLVTQIIYEQAIGVYTQAAASAEQLLTGINQWTQIAIPFSSLQTVGNAGLNNPGYTLEDVNSFQVQIVTDVTGGTSIGLDGLIAFGGSGPDSFGGVSYSWAYTYYNSATGTESNPCSLMSNPNPPQATTWLTPRRQPVLLTLVPSTDSQVTNIRIYRQGGTAADAFFRVAEIPANSTSFIDTLPDDQVANQDIMSLTNDVPVTSTLPVPVNTTLTGALAPTGTGQTLVITPASIAFISLNQQVTLGAITDLFQEVVIVQAVTGSTFTAFVQNAHAAGDPVTAESVYGQPVNISAIAFNRQYWAGDKNNPHFLYESNAFQPETLSAAGFVEVGTPDDPIIAVVPFLGSLYVATRSTWYGISPSQQTGQQPTVFPTTAVHGIAGAHGFVTTEREIWHQAVDGIRAFEGGSAVYRSLMIEALFQEYVPNETPIEQSNPFLLNQTVMAYWNNLVFMAYTGQDGNRYRLIYHTSYNRFRNDSVSALSMYLERDTNTLIYGDANGLIHQDRIGTFDEEGAGTIVDAPINFNLQTAYLDQGSPAAQKQYNELTLDCNTNGQTMSATLLFNDGEIAQFIGTFSTANRQKVNLNLNNGLGFSAYRVSLLITGSVTQQVIFNQVALRGIVQAETRQSFDSYFLTQGSDESKLCKQLYVQYDSTQPITGSIYYDQQTSPGFTFTLPATIQRTSTRVRLPAVKYRIIRLVITSTADYQLWDSFMEVKYIVTGKGWMKMPLSP